MCVCGKETVVALTPGARAVELEWDEHIYVADGAPWPRRAFIVGVSGGPNGPVVPCATPALEFVDRRAGVSGPFRREHLCATSS